MEIRMYLILYHITSGQDHEHNTCRTRVVMYYIGVDYISSAIQTFLEPTALP
jgi:hypothetical protein